MSGFPPKAETPAPQLPSLTAEEEDSIIHSRITNDERALRRVVKKFHAYSSVAQPSVVPHPSTSSTSVDDAREAFLLELATFSLQLKKAVMICEAEARQVEVYHRERQRIEDERGSLVGQIEQLKTSLEHAQMERRQKIEYDLVAEKINTLPSRQELERTISDLENDMAAIRAEHDTQTRLIQTQKSALMSIIGDLGSLRLMGKETDTPREVSPAIDPSQSETDALALPSPTPAASTSHAVDTDFEKEEGEEREEREEGEEEEDQQSSDDVPLALENTLNPNAKVFEPSRTSSPAVSTLRRLQSQDRTGSSASVPPSGTRRTAEGEDDIEMGELAEEPEPVKAKQKKVREEELEEGEASDESSALSDLPDDI